MLSVNTRRNNTIGYDQYGCRFCQKEDDMTNEWNYFDEVPQYHPIVDANNLYDAFYKSRKGSHWKAQVQRYRWDVLGKTRKLQKELENFQYRKPGDYDLSPYSEFFVNERGKVRAITALSIRDRVVKHVLNDNFLLPHIRPYLIYDNGASLQRKGVAFTRKRLLSHLRRFYQEHGNNGYVLLMDFSGYYDNIDHYKAMEIINKYETDELARRLVWQAYDSYKVDISDYEVNGKFNMVEYRHKNPQKRGEKFLRKSLSVGDQTSQITAVLYPTPIDNLIKIVLGIKYYARYMDDLYVLLPNIKAAEFVKEQISKKANELNIFINDKKTKIISLKHTFMFLQFKYKLLDNGFVLTRINPKTVTRMKRKLKKLARLGISTDNLIKSWLGSYQKYMSKRQVMKIASCMVAS